MTEKLFHADPYLKEFDAEVVDATVLDGFGRVVLNRTAFYPDSGGQPGDTGLLNGVKVLGTGENEGDVVHMLERELPPGPVHGKIDWDRRFDHMQQHLGQHILSQSFIKTAGAETVSFHLGLDRSTIDLEAGSLTDDKIERAEKLANAIVMENRPVTSGFHSADEVARMPLRKPPGDFDRIRIVTVADFDWSACAGTHCRCTGEVGLIKVTARERVRNCVRIGFVCGGRALADYCLRESALRDACGALSTSVTELGKRVRAISDENKATHKELKGLYRMLAEARAQSLASEAVPAGNVHVVCRQMDIGDMEFLVAAAQKIAQASGMVAILGGPAESGALVLSRSADVQAPDLRTVLKKVFETCPGKGGGSPNFVRAQLADGGKMPQAIEIAGKEAGVNVKG